MARILVRLGHELALADRALGARQHLCIDKLHQAPGAGKGQQHLEFGSLNLFGIEAIGLGQLLGRVQLHALGQVFVDIEKQRAVDVFLPGQKPVRGKRQLALGGRLARDFLVQPDQAFIRQRGLGLQHLHAGTHLDEHGGALDLLGFVQNAFGGSLGGGHQSLLKTR
ncbi:hypothetical protein SDC9_195287 [bioreactor metagenome]|uniref:Uncharacterized protein n=1 Tax=bioreactor metagenome TaxID=1076179 RepID=A0A645IK45_9ZZZZ